MASFFLAPDPLQSTFLVPGSNTPASGAQLFIYVAGSVSTKTTVYKDNAGSAQWSNPIVLDSGGNLPNGGVVWIPAGVTIKAVWAPSNDTDPPTSPYRTIDNISGSNDVTSSFTEWIAGPTPTFVSGTQFTLVGDQTSIFKKARRLKFSVTAGTVYGTITGSGFGAVTTVNVAFDSGALDSGLSAVSYSIIDPQNPSINAEYSSKYVTTVPSSGTGTTNIWGIAGDYTHITGTNNIFHFSTAPYAGAERDIVFDGVLTLTHTSSGLGISCPSNANIITAANDRARVRADTTTLSVITAYTKANGNAVTDQAPTATGRNISARTNSATTTKLDFSADEFFLKDSSGNSFRWSSSCSIDFTTTGANGLDTGTQSTSVFYYGWAIAKPDGTQATVGSLSSSSPTLPSGYTYKALGTSARSIAGPALIKYRQFGNKVQYEQSQNTFSSGVLGTTETTVALTSFVPPIALEAILNIQGTMSAGAGGAIGSAAYLRLVSSSNARAAQIKASANQSSAWGYEANVPNLGQVIALFDNTTNAAASLYLIDISGYKLPVGGE